MMKNVSCATNQGKGPVTQLSEQSNYSLKLLIFACNIIYLPAKNLKMKKIYLFILSLVVITCAYSQSVYVRFITYQNTSLYGTYDSKYNNPDWVPTPGTIDHSSEVQIATFSDNDIQTLNIGSQSSGSGAGKVTFYPISFSKTPDTKSPILFQMLCSGTAFQFVQISVYSGQGAQETLVYKEILGLAALQSISHATCMACNAIVENDSLEFGAKYVITYPINTTGTYGTPVGRGWDRVKNITWNGTTTP